MMGYFITNLSITAPVKEFLKSVNIWRSYRQNGWSCHTPHCTFCFEPRAIVWTPDVVYRAGSPGEHPGAAAAVRRLRLPRAGFPLLPHDACRPRNGGPAESLGPGRLSVASSHHCLRVTAVNLQTCRPIIMISHSLYEYWLRFASHTAGYRIGHFEAGA